MRVLLARTSVQSRPFGISSPLSRIAGCLISQSSTLLLVGKAGWLASGTRGRLICQLRQFGPPLCGPPYRRPPAESSHGSYERRALFQELCQIPVLILYPSQKVGSSAAKKWNFPRQKPKTSLVAVTDLKFQANIENGFFLAKILSRRSRLSRTTSNPSRLIRPRPIDCDKRHDPQMKISWGCPFFGSNISPKTFFFASRPLCAIKC